MTFLRFRIWSLLKYRDWFLYLQNLWDGTTIDGDYPYILLWCIHMDNHSIRHELAGTISPRCESIGMIFYVVALSLTPLRFHASKGRLRGCRLPARSSSTSDRCPVVFHVSSLVVVNWWITIGIEIFSIICLFRKACFGTLAKRFKVHRLIFFSVRVFPFLIWLSHHGARIGPC